MTTTAKLLNFRRNGEWYYFTFTAEGEDFTKALAALKTMVLEHRTYDATTKTWGLRVGPGTDRLLADIFANGCQCVETVAAQLPLF